MANKTIAEQIQFQLQFMGMMKMCGRNEMADTAYIKAQELTAELIEAQELTAELIKAQELTAELIELEKLNANLERVGS